MGRGRAPCCDKVGLNRGSWTPEEDTRLVAYIHKYGCGNWRALPKQAGLLRCGKSCRLRWINNLRPDIKRGNFSTEEEETVINLHRLIGNKWSRIASYLPGRTDNEIKNVWNTHLKKRVIRPPKEVKKLDARSMSSSKSISRCNQSDDRKEDNSMDNYEENIEILIEPRLGNTIEDSPEVMVASEELAGGGQRVWLAELEKELDLWGCEMGPGVELEGDMVSTYFNLSCLGTESCLLLGGLNSLD